MEDTPVTEKPEVPINNKSSSNKTKILLRVTIALLLIAAAFFAYWALYILNEESTDDAYVGGDRVALAARINGAVKAVYVNNTDFVKQGNLLVELDPTDYIVDLEKKKADFWQAIIKVKQLQDDVGQRRALLNIAQVEYERAEKDLANRKDLAKGAVAKEELEHTQYGAEETRAKIRQAKWDLRAAVDALGSLGVVSHPLIEEATVALKVAFLNLKRTKIVAPVDGYVANRSVQVGEWVVPGHQLLEVIPLSGVWVDANFKETQLYDIRAGQIAHIEADMYGSDVKYKGTVIGLQPGSGSAFSLLPPQNATGNWIKIVQRVPVRIVLDSEDLKKHPLVIGASVYVTVDTKDHNGSFWSEKAGAQPVMQTQVFDISLDEIENWMKKALIQEFGPDVFNKS